MFEGLARSFQPGVPALEERAHVRWNQGVGEAGKSRFLLHLAQVKRTRGVEVHDVAGRGAGADAALPGLGMKRHQSHTLKKCSDGAGALSRNRPAGGKLVAW